MLFDTCSVNYSAPSQCICFGSNHATLFLARDQQLHPIPSAEEVGVQAKACD